MCRVTLLCLEFLFVRSNRIYYVSCYSIESGISICTVSQRRISMCCVTVLSLESPVSQRRISMCRVTVLSLESLIVRSNKNSMCRFTVLSLESLYVRSNRNS